jgi:hypothetical protein
LGRSCSSLISSFFFCSLLQSSDSEAFMSSVGFPKEATDETEAAQDRLQSRSKDQSRKLLLRAPSSFQANPITFRVAFGSSQIALLSSALRCFATHLLRDLSCLNDLMAWIPGDHAALPPLPVTSDGLESHPLSPGNHNHALPCLS